ncbi:MAG: acyltransferase family protein [Candidatus Coprovivens sp.]
MKKEKRNGIISLWKFIFAITIVLFHSNSYFSPEKRIFMSGGYIAVEYFFIVSGFYLAKNTQKDNKNNNDNIGIETIKYIWKIIKNIFPYILIAYIGTMAINVYYHSYKMNDLVNSIWNLLLLRQIGIKSILVLPQFWYITSMLLSIFIIYPLLKKYKENYIYIASFLIAILGLGYLSHNWVGLNHAYQIWDKFTFTGNIRSFIEINIGVFIYGLNCLLKKVEYTKIGKTLITILGEGLLVVVLIIAQFVSTSKYYDYLSLLFIIIAILIITSEKTLEVKKLSNNFIYYLEKLSMPIFINHIMILEILSNINKTNNLPSAFMATIAIVITIFISMVESKLIKTTKINQVITKIKKVFIK